MLEQSYYVDIDEMPLKNWRKCQDGKLGYCRREWSKGDDAKDAEAWEMVQDSYLKEFGISQDLQMALAIEQDIMMLNLQIAETGERFLLNRLEMLKVQLEQLRSGGEDASTTKILIRLSKYMKFMLDEKSITVKEFYSILNEYNAEFANKQTMDNDGEG